MEQGEEGEDFLSGSRQPRLSETNELSVFELERLLDESRRPEDLETAALDGAQMDALLSDKARRGNEQATGEIGREQMDAMLSQERAISTRARPAAAPPISAAPIDDAQIDALFSEERPREAPTLPSHHAEAQASRAAPYAAPQASRAAPYVAPQASRPDATIALPMALAQPPPMPPMPWAAPASPARPAAPAAPGQAAAPLAQVRATAPARDDTLRTQPPPVRPRSAVPGVFIAVGGATLLAVLVGAVLFSYLRPEPPASASSGGSAAPASPASPSGATAASPSGASSSAASPKAASPEAEARAALARLRDGIGGCVREVIGVLPGTSPAVPSSLSLMQGGVYKSLARDFRSPVFACAKYKETEPQRFQIQWQIVGQPSEGRGVAWLDDDNDGKPDRAFGFRAALTRKNEVDLGEVGPIEPLPAAMKAVE
jgi:hypothetical protein